MTPEEWTSVRIRSPRNREAVVSALFALGAEGVHEVADDLITHIRRLDRTRADAALRDAADAPVEYAPTPDIDWCAEWRKRIRAHRVGRLVVTPPWLADQFRADERVVIDPAMAFGTGEHETTRGVLRLMQPIVKAGDSVADLGAGSAVLSIGAAKLGAARVVAIERDPDAIGNAEANVAANGVADRVTVIEGDAALLLPLVAPAHVVFANIISSVLLELLPVIHDALHDNGAAVLSGILSGERPDMLRELRRGSWRVREEDEEGTWWSVAITPA